MTEEQIFDRAIQLADDQRERFLSEACGEEPEQRERVEALIAAHEREDSLLDEAELGSTADLPAESSFDSRQIGNYKLLEKIGEGGMGSVYVAQQLRPVKRMVALKLIRAGMDSKQVVARFEAERQSLAMMDHPNIAKVLDAGQTERGEPYFVMELVKGVPITEYCDQNRLASKDRVKLMVDVCSAVQHAHQKGIIHRDLKPSNILVALYDDRPVPKVIDFGVAKATHQKLTEKTLYTQLGQIVGTLEYMSPEQAVLNQVDVDTRTDVYSLGVILYELLVGETPLDGKQLRSQGLEQMLRTIREQEPPRPSLRLSSQGKAATKTAAYRSTNQPTLSRTLRGDLDWIVMKALEKDRMRRYDSASRLADDLSNFLHGSVVGARPPSILYRLQKTTRRHRGVLAAGSIAVSGLILGLVFAIAKNIELRDKDYIATYHEIGHAYSIGDIRRARDALDRVMVGKAETEIEEQFYAAQINQFDVQGEDGRHLQSFSGGVAYLLGDSRSIKIGDLAVLESPTQIDDFAISNDGSTLATLTDNHCVVHEIDQTRVSLMHALELEGRVESLSSLRRTIDLSSDGKKASVLVINGDQREISVIDLVTGQVSWRASVASRKDDRIQARFSGNGKFLHVVARDDELQTYRTHDGSLTSVLDNAGSFLLETNGEDLLITGHGVTGVLYRVDSAGKLNRIYTFPLLSALAANFNRDSTRLAITDRQAIHVYDVKHDPPVRLARFLHEAMVDTVAFDDGGVLFSAEGRTLKSWPVSQPRQLSKRVLVTGNHYYVPALGVGKDRIAAATNDHTVVSVDLVTGIKQQLATHEQLISSVAVCPDDSLIASASRAGDVQLIDCTTGKATTLFASSALHMRCVAFSDDGQYLAACGTEGTLLIWRNRNWNTHSVVDCKGTQTLNRISFSPTGTYLLAAGVVGSAYGHSDGCTLLIDAASEKLVDSLTHADRVYDVAFPPTSDTKLAVSIRHGSVELYEIDADSNKARLRKLGVEMAATPFFVQSMQFSPDGRRLITASPNGQVRFWRVSDGAEISSFDSGRKVRELRFTKDFEHLVFASQDGVVEVLDAR